MKSFSYTLIAILFTLLFSCGGMDVEQTLTQAEDRLQIGDIETVASSCDMLVDSVYNLSSTQMCRVAILYAKLSEMADNQDYMASATKCYERALTIDSHADSLEMYIQSLDLDDQNVVRVIKEVSHAMTVPFDYSEFESEEDALGHELSDPQVTASL